MYDQNLNCRNSGSNLPESRNAGFRVGAPLVSPTADQARQDVTIRESRLKSYFELKRSK